MSNSSCLSRILFCSTLLLIIFSKAHASKTTWIGVFGATDWHTTAHWDNGIPTAMDSAIITGGNSIFLNIVLISNDAEALHVTVDNYSELSIILTGSLTVANATNFSIRIEENGSLLNFGSLTVSNARNGIDILGNFENQKNCTIDSVIGVGLYLEGSSSAKNQGDMFVMNTAFAVDNKDDAQYTNEGFMSIEDGTTGIINSFNANFENNGRIDISNMESHGINNFASFVNNGPIVLDSIASSSSLGVALFNSRGYFENNSNIVMSDILGTAIINGSYSDLGIFLNSGIIFIQDASRHGLIAEPMSKFTITEKGSLVLKSIRFTPLDILNGGELEVADGGFVNIIN